jgi:MinD-like ATPase involved in chromosome partitioning or flagellar assembly
MARWAPEGPPDRQRGVAAAAWPGAAASVVSEPTVGKDGAALPTAAPPINAASDDVAQTSTEAADNGSPVVRGYDLDAARKRAAADDDAAGDHPEADALVEFDAAKAVQRWTPRADAGVEAAGVAPGYIRVAEVVKTRRVPAEMGWRAAVYSLSGHVVNLGAGPAERELRDARAAITSNIPCTYQIAAVSIKGGVGKTSMVAGVGSVFALFRSEPVIAIDANPTYGQLGQLIDPRASVGVREFLADPRIVGYTRARQYTGQNPEGLEVLAGNQNVANPLAWESQLFANTLARAQRFYQLSVIDCGAEIEHQVMPAILSSVDALMIVASTTAKGALSAQKTIDWLAARNGHELLKRSVVVVNDVHRCANKKFITHMQQKLGPRVGAVKTIPWDPHLRDAVTLDWAALGRQTQVAFIGLAAELAKDFSTAGTLR